jgi:ornithine cyclodeaminase
MILESQRAVFAAYSRGDAALAPRALLDFGEGTAFSYLARASTDGPAVAKLGSVTQGNTERGLPNVQALILVLHPETGRLAVTIDGESVTLLRTAAASVVAVEALRHVGSTADVPRIAIVGTGRQAEAHREALGERWPRAEVTVVGRGGPVAPAVTGADTVILCTTSRDPVIAADWLARGTTVVSIGSFAPDRSEFGSDVIRRAGRVFADDADTASRQSGPVAAALRDGVLQPDGVVSLGDVLIGREARPTADDEVIAYTSVGLGFQDAAVAELLLEAADCE